MKNQKRHFCEHTAMASIIATVYSMIIASTFFMMPIYFQSELGFSTTEIGFILAAMSVTALLSMLPSGISNDLITSRRLAALALIILIISFTAVYFTSSFFPVLIIMLFIGAARELFRLSLETFIFKSGDLSTMPVILGNYHGPRMFGLFAGMIIASLILKSYNFGQFFLIISLALLFPLILTFSLPDVPIRRSTAEEYKTELIRPSIIIFIIFCVVFTSHWGAEYVNYGIFLSNYLRLSNSQSALYMSFEFLLIGLTIPLFARSYRKIRLILSTTVALLLSGMGHIFMVNKEIYISLLFRGIHGIGDGLLMIITYMIIAENFSRERIGGLNAVVNVAMMLGMLIGSIIFGYIGEKYGSDMAIKISGIVTLLSIPIIYLWFYFSYKKVDNPRAL